MEDVWWVRAVREYVWPKYYKLPKEMRKDPLLNHLNVSEPFGESHECIRNAYYSFRDGKRVNQHGLRESFETVCHKSPELFNRTQDDTPQELRIICGTVGYFLAEQDRIKRAEQDRIKNT